MLVFRSLMLVSISFSLLWAASLTHASVRNERSTAVPKNVDVDYYYQGEYVGVTNTPLYGVEATGLQVIALGNAEFRAVQFRGGLPGAGWNLQDKVKLSGIRELDTLWLGDDQYRIAISGSLATLRNSTNQVVGHLRKIQRASSTLGLAPSPQAKLLFDGTDTSHFKKGRMTADGLLKHGAMTKESFGDFRMHLEFRTPYMPNSRGQSRGNSGVYIQQRYELQILDSFGLEGVHNECGGLYRTHRPDVNMCFPPLTWQTYDIYFTAAKWSSNRKKTVNARLTVVHNGVLIHNDFEVKNKTGAGKPEGPDPRPIWFQDHRDPVTFRNIWVVQDPEPQPAHVTHLDSPENIVLPIPSVGNSQNRLNFLNVNGCYY